MKFNNFSYYLIHENFFINGIYYNISLCIWFSIFTGWNLIQYSRLDSIYLALEYFFKLVKFNNLRKS